MDDSSVTVREHRLDEVPAAVGVLARGMRDNPGHIAAFGKEPDRRRRALVAMFTGLLRATPSMERFCADQDGTIAGFAAAAPPGTCRGSRWQKLRIATSLAAVAPTSLPRVMAWQGTWARHDPDVPHSHFGPIAVDADRQGQGIGSLLMREYLRRLDIAGEGAYLETDKPENVSFYERFGFVVTGEEDVLGDPNWFMFRETGGWKRE